MNLRVIVAFGAALLAAACTDADWAHTMSYAGFEQPDQAPPAAAQTPVRAPAPVADATEPNGWCMAVATNDRTQAAGDGFDQATQQRAFATSYAQCVTISGGASPP